MLIEGSFCTYKGNREVNQDSLFIDGIIPEGLAGAEQFSFEANYQELPIVVGVFDGLGGEGNGDTASNIAAQSMSYLKDKINGISNIAAELIDWADAANRKIVESSLGKGATTVAVTVIEDNKVVFAHLGDSRAYMIRNGKIEYVTEDHTEAVWLKKMGLPPRSNNRLTRYLGMDSDGLIIEPTINDSMRPEVDDCIVLCTDGIWNSITVQELMMCTSDKDPAVTLVRYAIDKGSTDNCTAIVLHVKNA